MMPSLPCPNCGQIELLETVNPLGIFEDKAVFWLCPCGYPRVTEIHDHTPQELVRKALAANEKMDRIRRSHGSEKEGWYLKSA